MLQNMRPEVLMMSNLRSFFTTAYAHASAFPLPVIRLVQLVASRLLLVTSILILTKATFAVNREKHQALLIGRGVGLGGATWWNNVGLGGTMYSRPDHLGDIQERDVLNSE